MEIKDLLPIGTVVLLEGGKKRLMIFGIKQLDEADEQVEYDYAAVPYPEGNIGIEGQFLFNHDQIQEVIFYGYDDDERTEFINALDEFYSNSAE